MLKPFDTYYKYLTGKKKQARGLPFGIERVDRGNPAGILPGTLTAIVAGPSHGKTALACYWASLWAKENNTKSIIVSMEMKADDISQRIIAAAAGIPVRHLNAVCMNGPEGVAEGVISAVREAYDNYAEKIDELITIIDTQGSPQSAETICRMVDAVEERNGPSEVVFVDHFGQVRDDYADSDWRAAESSATKLYSDLVIKGEKAVIVLAHSKPRNKTYNHVGQGGQGGMRGGDGLLIKADLCIELEQPAIIKGETDRFKFGDVFFTISKNRNGRIWHQTIFLEGDVSRFWDSRAAYEERATLF